MTITFEAMPHDAFTKALYAVLVDGEKVGIVAHRRVEHRVRFTRWTRANGPVDVTRRSKPLAWVATGTRGRVPVREVRTSRQKAVEALLVALEIGKEARR